MKFRGVVGYLVIKLYFLEGFVFKFGYGFSFIGIFVCLSLSGFNFGF